jgi:hypothetical protein
LSSSFIWPWTVPSGTPNSQNKLTFELLRFTLSLMPNFSFNAYFLLLVVPKKKEHNYMKEASEKVVIRHSSKTLKKRVFTYLILGTVFPMCCTDSYSGWLFRTSCREALVCP